MLMKLLLKIIFASVLFNPGNYCKYYYIYQYVYFVLLNFNYI